MASINDSSSLEIKRGLYKVLAPVKHYFKKLDANAKKENLTFFNLSLHALEFYVKIFFFSISSNFSGSFVRLCM